MERDEYWLVLQKIHDAKGRDIQSFADALGLFGLLEIATLAERAKQRQRFLDEFDVLIANSATLEAQVHKAFEGNHWMLGVKYAALASNTTLGRIIEEYTTEKYVGDRAAKCPDLLMMQDAGDRYLLIEFKRPAHSLSRLDEAQAKIYRDELMWKLPGKGMDILLLGGGRAAMETISDTADVRFVSYADMLSDARYQLDWLINALSR